MAHGERLCCHRWIARGHGLVTTSHGIDGVWWGILIPPGGDSRCGVYVSHHGAIAGGEHRGRCECLLELLLLLAILGATILEPDLERKMMRIKLKRNFSNSSNVAFHSVIDIQKYISLRNERCQAIITSDLLKIE